MFRRAVHVSFTILSAASLLLCVAVCVSWVRNRAPGPFGEPGGWRARAVLVHPRAHPPNHRVMGGEYVTMAIADLEGPGLTVKTAQRVDLNGAVALPYLGAMRVVGLDAQQIADAAVEQYRFTTTVPVEDEVRVTLWEPPRLAPYALLTAVLAALPAVWTALALGHFRQQRRVASGRCPKCSYDLRASPERCPECGAVVPKPT